MELSKHTINISRHLIRSEVQYEQSNLGKYKIGFRGANDPGWQREELSSTREEECTWGGGLGSFQEVLRARLWSISVLVVLGSC